MQTTQNKNRGAHFRAAATKIVANADAVTSAPAGNSSAPMQEEETIKNSVANREKKRKGLKKGAASFPVLAAVAYTGLLAAAITTAQHWVCACYALIVIHYVTKWWRKR